MRWTRPPTARGEVIAAPTDIGPGTMLYRTDCWKRPVSPSRSVAVVGQLRRRRQAHQGQATGAYLVSHVQSVKDIVIRTGIAKPGEGLYFDRDSRVLVNSPRFVRAFELAREMRAPSWTRAWACLVQRMGRRPQARHPGHRIGWRLAGGPAEQLGRAHHEGACGARRSARRTPLPAMAVPSTPSRAGRPGPQGLAWEFIRLMTLDPAIQPAGLQEYDAFPSLLQTHDDPFFDEPLPFLGGQRARTLWREAARRIAPVVHKQSGFADEVIGTELDNVIDRDKDIRQALADAERLLQRRARR
jgi:multiple sugar transport system substrate-binding protein